MPGAEDRFSQVGPSSDHVFADTIGSGSRFRSLEYKVQAVGYIDGTFEKGVMSYRGDGQANVPTTSPRLAYDTLFTGFVPGGNTGNALAAERALQKRRSVIDIVRGNAQRLRARLGRSDNQRLDRHFDEIRSLEERLQLVEPEVDSLCVALDAAAYANDPAAVESSDEFVPGRAIGYADEARRSRLLCDLVHMALVCDLTRTASVMITHAQSHMNVSNIIPSGAVTDVHELGHGSGSPGDHDDMMNWHVDQFAYLTRKLKDTPEGNGTMLDRTAMALLFEGGSGFDPETGEERVPHSSEEMVMVVGGAGLRGGQHVDGSGFHPAQGLLACGRAIGHTGNLNDFSTVVPNLLP
jgi:Protein of unknown function (DUF1552)